jgi:hypothetical protein
MAFQRLKGLSLGTWIRLSLAVVLIVGFATKLLSLDYQPIHAVQQFSFFYHVAAILELFLAIWLIIFMYPRICLVCIALFFCLGIIHNLYLVIQGETSCGCFGAVQVPPIVSIGIDVICIALCIAALSYSPINNLRFNDPLFNPFTIGIASLICLSFIYTNSHFNIMNMLSNNGDVFIDKSIINIGDGILDDKKEVAINVTNGTNMPIRIVGFKSTCDCIVVSNLPVVLPAHSDTSIMLQYKYVGNGSFNKLVRLYVESPSIWLETRLIGRVKHTTEPISGG